MPSPEEIRAVVTRYLEAMSAGDKEGYVALFAPDATIEDPVGTDVHRGHDEIRAFWDMVHTLSSSITLVPTGPARVAGREVAFPMQAISDVGGSKVVVDIIDVFALDDEGRITSMRAFWDPAEMRPYEG
ncbi:SgcJ/EcaC family oxidoreductase [Rhabdothermincola sp.]|mgnify:CR=1 FL=1|uniref:SgcJ/EcaC family oxidoreductase n=1 Tax=Rhabdothermincola sp. TaxID=2820405 RepID=UPI002FE03E60